MNVNIIELRTLGVLDLRWREGASIQSVLAQPKRSALLIYLALARPRGLHQRERLLGLLWGEMEEERARKALRQSLYFLRASLGESALETVGDNAVGVSRDHVWCDAVELDRSLEEGRAEEAFHLFGGELLPGFYVEDAPEFERWLEAERQWRRSRVAEAAWRLAEAHVASGQASAAAEWGRKAAGFSPGDETVARRLMTLLERVGDRASALHEYEAFTARLSQEYGLEPSAETRALAQAIRHGPHSVTNQTDDSAAVAIVENPAVAGVHVLASQPKHSVPAQGDRSRPGKRVARLLLAAIGLAIAGVAGWILMSKRSDNPRDAVKLSANIAAAPEIPSTAHEWYRRGVPVRFAGYVERDIRYGIYCFEQAVLLDSAFAKAWAALAIAHADLHWFFEPTRSRAEAAFHALEQAEKLAPRDPETRLASGVYAYRIRRDYQQALDELRMAQRDLPDDPRIYHMTASIHRRMGRWGDATNDWHRALELEPHSAALNMEAGTTSFLMRRYEESVKYLTTAVTEDPSLVTAAAMLAWATLGRDGDAGESTRILARTASAGVAASQSPFLQYTQWMMHLLDGNPQRALEALEPGATELLEYQWFAIPRALLRGQIHAILGETRRSQADLIRARRVLEARLEASADDARLHSALGPTLAGLGETEPAVRHAERAAELVPLSSDAWFASYYLDDLALTLALVGNVDAAIAIYERLLSQPGPLSRAQLRLDPRLARLRSDSRFQKIIHE